MVWFYLAVLVAAAGVAFLFARLVKDQAAKTRIGGWVSVVVGAAFVLIYALEPERELFLLAIGLTCLVGGVLALVMPSTQRMDAGPRS